MHLDLNPWWWSESSADILTGVETLSYSDPQVQHGTVAGQREEKGCNCIVFMI